MINELRGHIDRLFYLLDCGKMKPEEAEDILILWQFIFRTGTEAELVMKALDKLKNSYYS